MSDAAANFDRWASPDFDALCRKADVETDPKKREDLYLQAESVMINEMPRVPLYHGVDGILVHPRVKGLRYNLLGVMPHTRVSVDP